MKRRQRFFVLITFMLAVLMAAVYAQSTGTSAGTSATVLQWQWDNPLPSGDYFNAVAYGGGLYVAAGDDGVLYTSSDESNWTAQTGPLGVGGNYSALYYANGLFLALGTDASGKTHVCTSSDGVHWTDTVLALSAGAKISQIGYGNGTWMLTGTLAETSTDGVSWTAHSIASNYTFSSVIYANGVFAVLGSTTVNGIPVQTVFYSVNNGQSWTQSLNIVEGSKSASGVITTNGTFAGNFVSNGTEFVLLGDDGSSSNRNIAGLIYTSTDGVHWTQQADAPIYGFGGTIIYNSNAIEFVAEAYDSNGQLREYTSTDGILWTFGATGASTNFQAIFGSSGVAVTPSGYISVDGENGPMGLATSTDYVNWNGIFGVSSPQQTLNDVLYAQGHFIAAGSGIIMESVDGQTWKTVYSSSALTFGPSIYGNGMYATNAHTQLVVSSDGINWRAISLPLNAVFNFITFGNGIFVATGQECSTSSCNPMLFTSSDLQSWKSESLSALTRNNLGPVGYNGQRFVILTDDSTGDGIWMLTSGDGLQWNAETFDAAPDAYFTQLRVADGQFMAIGGYSNAGCADAINNVCRSPYIATSNDGLTWGATQISKYPNSQLNDVTYTGSEYIATIGAAFCGLCPSYQSLLYSADGTNWVILPGEPIDAKPLSITTGGTQVVAAGLGGTIISAPNPGGNSPPPGVPSGSGGTTSSGGSASGGGAESLLALAVLCVLMGLRNRLAVRSFPRRFNP